jgi:phosphatidylserine decarboxylase
MMMDQESLKLAFSGRLHPEGWFFIRWGVFLCVVFFFVSNWLAALGVLGTLCVAFFFRDPNRTTPENSSVVVSPADGLIVDIGIVAQPPKELEMPAIGYYKISIFLNLWDVHVNRIPLSGKILHKKASKGTFKNAATEEASLSNERVSLVIEGEETSVGCIQIAGLLARRIVCDPEKGDEVQLGQRYGIICFGSRVDCYIPEKHTLSVCLHQRMIAGETILARI